MPLTQLTQKLILKGAFNLQYEYYLVLDVYAGKFFKKKMCMGEFTIHKYYKFAKNCTG